MRVSVTGGKRIRPAFCYWGWRASGQPDTDAMIRAATALELVHAAAIVHDDIIDRSPLRRGRPTAHEKLGDALAIMIGDLLMAWAGQLFHTSGLPRAFLARAVPMWTTMGRELVAGECLEILRTGPTPDLARSLAIVRFKTGTYTVERPLQIGAVLGGAAPATLDAWRRTRVRSARRSSCGTTCGECSATRRAPASRPSTTWRAANRPP